MKLLFTALFIWNLASPLLALDESYTLSKYDTGSHPEAMVALDINNDRLLDLVVINNKSQSMQTFLGQMNAPSLFSLKTPYSSSLKAPESTYYLPDPSDLKQISFSAESPATFLMGHFLHNAITIHHVKSDYQFTTEDYFVVPFDLYDFGVVDLNGDFIPDLIAMGISEFAVYPGNKDQNFDSDPLYFANHEQLQDLSAIRIADVNQDGHLDIVMVDSEAHQVLIYAGDSLGQFTPIPLQLKTGVYPYTFKIQDLNNDNAPEIVVGNFMGEHLDIFWGQTYAWPHSSKMQISSHNRTVKLAIGDMNNDGFNDLLTVSFNQPWLFIYPSDQGKEFDPSQTTMLKTGDNPRDLILEDFNQDEVLDIAILNNRGNSIWLYLSKVAHE